MSASPITAEAAYAAAPKDVPAWLASLGLEMTIGGADAPSGAYRQVIDPCSEQPLAAYPEADIGHLERAATAAAAAFRFWSAEDWATRRAALERFADLLLAHRFELALIVASESGRPLRRAWSEITFSIDYVRILAAQVLPPRRLDRPGLRVSLTHKALGVVGAIAPWNAPVILAVAKIANALIVGDTIILRPSPFTPLSALYLGRIGRAAFPPGVLNVITGDAGVGAAMTTHPTIAKISFTGSTATGKLIAAAAAPTLKRLTLELGGNDAAIVLADADVAAVAQTVFNVSLGNAGHFCAAIKRLYVHDSLYDAVCEALTALIGTTVLGGGFVPEVTMGPVQNRPQFERVWAYFDDAVDRGAKVIAGGNRFDGPGLFIPPTLVDGISHGVRLVDEEQFGPVLPVMRFTDEEAVLSLANDTAYGLGGSVWSRDIDHATALAERMQVGTAWINQHGAFTASLPMAFAKESGVGSDYAEFGLAEHSRVMLINARL